MAVKTKAFFYLIISTCISSTVYCQENKTGKTAIDDFKISADIEKSYAIACSPYNVKQDSLVVRNDLDKIIVSRDSDDSLWREKSYDSDKESVADREAEYSQYWIGKAIKRKLYDFELNDKIQFVQNINGKDDAVILRFSYEKYAFEIIDSRQLTVLIANADAKEDVLDIFNKFIAYKRSASDNDKVKPEALVRIDDSKSYGKINVVSPGWFCHSIEWYRDNDKILFLFDKTLTPLSGKGSWRSSCPVRIVGGMPYSDSRKFLRFEKSNRIDLSKEYFKKLEFPEIDKKEEISKKDSAGTLQGRISEADEELEKIKEK